MRIGMLGAGKLGGPVALAFESKDHDVLVCDKAEWVQKAFAERKWPHKERGVPELMAKTNIRCVTLSELVQHSEIIFVAVQTPHEPQYGGAAPLPDDRKDFDYTALKQAVTELEKAMRPIEEHREPIIAVISTVLPGTMRREIIPLLLKGRSFVYCPFFAAMGTVVEDVLDPEFVLAGLDGMEQHRANVFLTVGKFFSSLHHSVCLPMSIESAELTKVAYNLWLSAKIAVTNTFMEVAHRTPGCDIDEVTGALKLATSRLVSTRYMDAGTGDGGPCHCRDLIAMDWFARKTAMGHSLFGEVMKARESQAEWLVDLFCRAAGFGKPLVLFGKSYKPDSELVDGSFGLLMGAIIKKKWLEPYHHYDPFVDGGTPDRYLDRASAYLICTKHPCFAEYRYPPGSVVVDPFRMVPQQDGVRVVSVGRGM